MRWVAVVGLNPVQAQRKCQTCRCRHHMLAMEHPLLLHYTTSSRRAHGVHTASSG